MKLIENCNLLTAAEASVLVPRNDLLIAEGLNASPESTILDDKLSNNVDAQNNAQLLVNNNSQTNVIELSSQLSTVEDSVQIGKLKTVFGTLLL